MRCELRLNLEARAIPEFFRRRALAIIHRRLPHHAHAAVAVQDFVAVN